MSADSSLTKLSLTALTLPVAMGYIPLGAVFGFLFVQAGASTWLAVLSSVVIYAGAAQYMMIPMLVAGASFPSIALATLVINLRHVFYGLSLLQRFPPRGLMRLYMVFGLTDETYSVLTTLPAQTPHKTLFMLTALNQLWWVLGTLIGAIVGAQAQLSLKGLDFVLACLFAVLATEQWRRRSSAWPVLVALPAYGAALLISQEHALSLAIGLCVLAAMFIKKTKGIRA
jgi:4-azaleucine resistance transporter AzlC